MYISCLFNCFVRSLVSKCYSLIHLFVCVLGFLWGSGDKKSREEAVSSPKTQITIKKCENVS